MKAKEGKIKLDLTIESYFCVLFIILINVDAILSHKMI